MGFWMGLLRWIIRALVVFSIAVFLLASVGYNFSEKDNLKVLVQDAALSQISDAQITKLTADMSASCLGKSSINSYIEQANMTVTIDCNNLTEEYVKNIYKEDVVGAMFERLYSQKCDGIVCLISNPVAALGESANKTLKSFKTFSLVIALVFMILLMIITPGISRKLVAAGSPVLFTGIPYFFMGMIKARILKSVPAQSAAVLEKIVDPVLAYASNQFLIIFIIGAALIIAGFIVKLTIERKKKIKKGGKKK